MLTEQSSLLVELWVAECVVEQFVEAEETVVERVVEQLVVKQLIGIISDKYWLRIELIEGVGKVVLC